MSIKCGVKGCDNGLVIRGMCERCYQVWSRNGRPEMDFDTRSKREIFIGLCEDGTIKDDLKNGSTYIEIADHYNVSVNTVKKYSREFNIDQYNKKAATPRNGAPLKRERVIDNNKLLAMHTAWVKHEDRRYHFSV